MLHVKRMVVVKEAKKNHVKQCEMMLLPTSNLIVVVLLQLGVIDSPISKPKENRQRLIPLLPDRVKLSTGDPCTAISGVTECWFNCSNNERINKEIMACQQFKALRYSSAPVSR